MNWYLLVFKKYFVFNGRARRTEYWMFVLFNLFFSDLAIFIDNITKFTVTISNIPFGIFYLVYICIALIPGIAVEIRRLHDVGLSGWLIFIFSLPFILLYILRSMQFLDGGIASLTVLMLLFLAGIATIIWRLSLLTGDSSPDENQYGQNPKVIQTENENKFSHYVFPFLNRDRIVVIILVCIILYPLIGIVNIHFYEPFHNYYGGWMFHNIKRLIWLFAPLGLVYAIDDLVKRRNLFIVCGIYLQFLLLYNLYKINMLAVFNINIEVLDF